MTGKHPKTTMGKDPNKSDLVRNPGIGTSKGTFSTGIDPHAIEGENTIVGDIGNDTTPQGGVDPNQLGRTNK